MSVPLEQSIAIKHTTGSSLVRMARSYVRLTIVLIGAFTSFAHPSTVFATVETFSTAGTANWTVPANVYSVTVECWGGGDTSYFTDGNFVVRVIAHPESNVLRIDALQVRPYSELGGGSPGGGDAI